MLYNVINKEFGTKGSARISYKIHGEGKTDITRDEALEELKEGLRDEKKAYIVSIKLVLIKCLFSFTISNFYESIRISSKF